MFSRNDEQLLRSLRAEYSILVSNGHDIHLKSCLTGHEWIIISRYDSSACEILHRHLSRYLFHHQRGQYSSLESAIDYICRHDIWYYNKKKNGHAKYHSS